ncbi:PorP/SprF family type IX secretion system membrane protein [Marivirga sp. S37H4]|uniref:PorP/SprF family type IX secretion system membrane protein n=1 Tax=Marivirga aurantiaca TaxID=2802615 RepID=A0A935C864_9BACT|nr:PorP/SprF family type IX secretion system membrane protein [Marivirga aurantiaca]MBK6265330.1 PorP/SprF family type IX secretion system membrane protein [Marivirga aurantiaca]
MRKFYILAVLSLGLSLVPKTSFTQDAYFSQFYANPIYLNSALAGSEGNPRLTFIHRQQWNAVNAFNSSFFSFDNSLGKNSGWAVHAMKDTQLDGVINNLAAGTTLSHRIALNKGAVLGGGISLAYRQKSFNWGNLVFEDQLRSGSNNIYPTAERIGESKTVMYDVGIGMVYASEKLMAGINVAHINQPVERFNPESEVVLPRRYTLHVAYSFQKISRSNNGYHITPSVIYENQAGLSYLNVGGYWNNELLTFGSWYRVNQAVVFTAGISINQINIGYSYDYTVNQSASTFGSTNEFSVSYRFQVKKSNKNYKYAGKCPDVFKRLR